MKKFFITGLIVWVPITITFFVVRFIVNLFDQILTILPANYQPHHLLGISLPGMGIILTVLLIFFTGFLMHNFLGNQVLRLWDNIVNRIPIIRSIYSAVSQVMTTLFTDQSTSFKRVVYVEWPKADVWSVGFVTNNQPDNNDSTRNEIIVFIPTSPNPTSGFLTLVQNEQVRPTKMTVEQGFKMILSLGVVLPEHSVDPIKSHS